MSGQQPPVSPSTAEPPATTEAKWKPLPPQAYGAPRVPIRKPVPQPAGSTPAPIDTRWKPLPPQAYAPVRKPVPRPAGPTPAPIDTRWKPLAPQSYGNPRCPVRKPVARPAGVVAPPVLRAPVVEASGAIARRPVPPPETSHTGTKVSLKDDSKLRIYWCEALQAWRRVPELDRDAK